MSAGRSAWGKAAFVLPFVAVHWILLPLWAWSTCRHRRSLYVRVRSFKWLIADLVQILVLITSLGFKEVFGYWLPCPLTDALAAVGLVSLPGFLLWRTLHLWYAFKLMEGKDAHVVSLHGFSATLSTLFFVLAIVSAAIATSGRQLCLSDMCTVQCYWASQYMLLLPLTLLMALAQILSFRLLSSTRKVERLGLQTELRRVLRSVALLMITAYVLTVLIDLGVVDLGGHGHTIISILYMLAYSSRFITLHVLPSIAYGYYPRPDLFRCRRLVKVLPHPPIPMILPLRGTGVMGDRAVVAATPGPRRGSKDDPLLGSAHLDPMPRFNAPPPIVPYVNTPSVPLAKFLPLLQHSESSINSSSSSASYSVAPPPSWELSELLNPYNPQYAAFLAFCQSLLCDHNVHFLMAAKPMIWQLTGAAGDQVTALEAPLVDLYATYLSSGAPRAVTLDAKVRRAFRRWFEPERRSSVGRGMPYFLRSSSTGTSRTTNEFDGAGDSPESAISQLLQRAYDDVARALTTEVLPLFHQHVYESDAPEQLSHGW